MVDDSHEISYLVFFLKLGRMSRKLSSAAVVIGALMINYSRLYDHSCWWDVKYK